MPKLIPATAGLALLLSLAGLVHAEEKSVPLSVARAELLAKGWKPVETFGVDADGRRWNQQGNAGEIYRAGIIEVEECSGTGQNFCSFNYGRKGKCLLLQSRGEFKTGEYEPLVFRRSSTCPTSDLDQAAHQK
ncbi:hypothetical protein [Aquabacterium sp. CECT 9606]|uniref:hypothetical protein n=1 Tax=Aquabacterium sp. CECT 9606 TaxID=2845822 RepID=UPI001E4077E5|nr:hypothetical protein [Aquabacterium sp. CECT 9606]